MLHCWQRTIHQDEWLFIIWNICGGQEGVYQKLG